ncbi:ubiquitin-like domain-containing protein [Fonticella tunisiensis]|nr:ubiquitin-like domain-containing protein [Fonticella tunisiensis]
MAILAVTVVLVVLAIKRKTITVNVNGKQIRFTTYGSSVGEALKHENIIINAKDKVEPSLDSKLVENGTINIKRAVNVTVAVDEKELAIQSSEENVDKMLKAEGISLNSEDRVKPDKDEKLSDGMRIEITRIETKTVVEDVPVNFKEVVKTDPSLPNTKRQVIKEGKNGEKRVTSLVVYENGKEVSKKVVSETVIKEPVDRLIVQGTYPSMPVSRGGGIIPYRRMFKARATAYWAVNGVGKTYTASGRKAVRNPDGYSTIAVDPSIIPFGTRLFVEGYGFAIAAETGSGIKGDKIDVFFNTYEEARKWAVKYVNVYVLN